MNTVGLVVVMLGLVASAEAETARPGISPELAKLELWGKANLGFVRKSEATT